MRRSRVLFRALSVRIPSYSTSPVLEAEGLTRSFSVGEKTVPVLRDLSLKIVGGERAFLTGSSGAGKTTLLYTLAGLEAPDSGEVKLGEKSLYKLSRSALATLRNERIGYIFQNYHLLPELTAVENVALPALISGGSLKETRQRASALLEKVGLGDRLDHLPAELSGGEQQRAAIARSLTNDPEILLADEPTGNLDSKNGRSIIELLLGLAEDAGKTLLVVTHDASLASLGTRHITIHDGQLA